MYHTGADGQRHGGPGGSFRCEQCESHAVIAEDAEAAGHRAGYRQALEDVMAALARSINFA